MTPCSSEIMRCSPNARDCPAESRYMEMLEEEENVEMRYNLTISVANWALLAGYLVVPGTFTTLQKSSQMEEVLKINGTGRVILHSIQNPPLLVIACVLFASGVAALVWLLRQPKLRMNYVWLINRLLMPMSLNAAAGLLTTLINVCTSKGRNWSVMAITTVVMTGSTMVIFSTLLVIYKFYLLEQIKKQHETLTHFQIQNRRRSVL